MLFKINGLENPFSFRNKHLGRAVVAAADRHDSDRPGGRRRGGEAGGLVPLGAELAGSGRAYTGADPASFHPLCTRHQSGIAVFAAGQEPTDRAGQAVVQADRASRGRAAGTGRKTAASVMSALRPGAGGCDGGARYSGFAWLSSRGGVPKVSELIQVVRQPSPRPSPGGRGSFRLSRGEKAVVGFSPLPVGEGWVRVGRHTSIIARHSPRRATTGPVAWLGTGLLVALRG